MRAVEVRLKRQKLADALGDMRQWLDRYNCAPMSFELVRGKRGALSANVVFNEDHIADTFQRDFGRERRPIRQAYPPSTSPRRQMPPRRL